MEQTTKSDAFVFDQQAIVTGDLRVPIRKQRQLEVWTKTTLFARLHRPRQMRVLGSVDMAGRQRRLATNFADGELRNVAVYLTRPFGSPQIVLRARHGHYKRNCLNAELS